jgi:uncharacterized phage protein gp47/JayE
MAYGIQPTGFVIKPYETIVEEMRAKIRTRWGEKVNLAPDSDLGQIIDGVAVKIAELWEVAEASYAARDPDSAEDAALDAVAAFTGTERDPATRTRVRANVNLDAGTYAAGSLVAHPDGDPTRRFYNVEAITNAGPTAATSVDQIFEAEQTGPVPVTAGTLTVMANAVSGWNSVINIADAYSVGKAIEGNESLRAKREAELAAQGSTNADAVRADLLRIENASGARLVRRVRVLQNDTDEVDADGLLPHSIEAIVYGPDATDAQIAAVIFSSKAGGANTNGTTSVNVTDDQGVVHVVKFTRPTTLAAYASVTIVTDADTYAGDDVVKASIAATDEGFGPGDALLWTRVIGAAYEHPTTDVEIAGVERVTSFGLATSGGGPFLQADITPTIRQVVTLDTANVTVVHA